MVDPVILNQVAEVIKDAFGDKATGVYVIPDDDKIVVEQAGEVREIKVLGVIRFD